MIIMLHYVFPRRTHTGSSSTYKPKFHCKAEFLDSYISTSIKNGFEFITFSEYVKLEHSCKHNKICLTFDDGTFDHFMYVLPILNKHRIQASFYPITSRIEENRSILPIHLFHIIDSCIIDRENFINNLKSLIVFGLGNESWQKKSSKYSKMAGLDNPDILTIKRILELDLSPREACDLLYDSLRKVAPANFSEVETIASSYYLSLDELLEIKQSGSEIGTHSHSHIWYSSTSDKQMKADLNLSISVLRSFKLLKQEWTICYPHGDWSLELLTYLDQSTSCSGGLVIDDVIGSCLSRLTYARIDVSNLSGYVR